MHLTRIVSAKKVGFTAVALYPRREMGLETLTYLKQKSSFCIAVMSLVAFVAGNMVGEHGWYAFWKSVMGKYDDSLIVYTGTVPPLAMVPDYSKWSQYGGDAEEHTYRQVPADLLMPLPSYNQAKERQSESPGQGSDIYSVGNMGSYETGAEGHGSHPGVDIRVPEGTPVRSIANGIVTRVSEDRGGYGQYIVIRHPNVPDPADPSTATVLHSVYAHLSSQMVAEGDLVSKGQQIGLSGKTGFATGPHLHFQIDRDDAPWHPYWPFTTSEATDAGYSFVEAINHGLHQERLVQYTIHPMLYVQANYSAPTRTEVVRAGSSSSSPAVKSVRTVAVLTPAERQQALRDQAKTLRDLRMKRRLAQRKYAPSLKPVAQASSAGSLVVHADAVAVNQPMHPSAPVAVGGGSASTDVRSVRIEHDGSYRAREWETVRIRLVDANGETANADTMKKDIVLRASYGEAEFNPPVLTPLDFRNGMASVQVLPRGQRTLVITVYPFGVLSSPMKFSE